MGRGNCLITQFCQRNVDMIKTQTNTSCATISQIKKQPDLLQKTICVKGWVRTVRGQKTLSFIEVNDGSCLASLQIVYKGEIPPDVQIGSSVFVEGTLVQNPKNPEQFEVQASNIEVIGSSPADYPLQKKRHSFEFLRSIAHLRPRTNTFGAVIRTRSRLSFAIHEFFQKRDFFQIHTPVITATDCEGAGELFTVTSLDLQKTPKSENGRVDFAKDFFARQAYLNVSGQLNLEAFALSMRNVYTFGPTFRAENSHTSRHVAEFWMVEPEMAFANLQDAMNLADSFIHELVGYALENCSEDLVLFDQYIQKGLLQSLQDLEKQNIVQMPYTEAIKILEKCSESFEYPVKWGIDLQAEHERFLAEKHCQGPVIVFDYPKEIKPFYMKLNDDEKTVTAMDLLVPGIGELIGGGQREDRLSQIKENIEKHNLDADVYQWYVDLRKYGSAPHAGFGLGFERLVQFITGMGNIRDVIAFPRYPNHADF